MRYPHLLALLTCTALLAVLPLAGLPPYFVSLLTQTFIFGIAAAGLDLLVGRTGMVSFSQAAFFGLGAYSVGLLTTRLHVESFPLILTIGVVAAVAVAALFAMVALRGSGVSYLIITLALNQIVWGLAFQWVSVTGGENGISGFIRPRLGPVDLSGSTEYYLFSLVVMVVCLYLLWLVANSPFGLVLQGIREQPRRMRALGYNVWGYQFAASLIAAAFAAVAGVLFAYYNLFVSPANLSLSVSTQMLIMVILGGSGTILGPVLGAGIITFLGNTISSYTERWQMILGAIYVLIVLYAPDGLTGLVQRLRWPTLAWAHKKRGPHPAAIRFDE